MRRSGNATAGSTALSERMSVCCQREREGNPKEESAAESRAPAGQVGRRAVRSPVEPCLGVAAGSCSWEMHGGECFLGARRRGRLPTGPGAVPWRGGEGRTRRRGRCGRQEQGGQQEFADSAAIQSKRHFLGGHHRFTAQDFFLIVEKPQGLLFFTAANFFLPAAKFPTKSQRVICDAEFSQKSKQGTCVGA